VCPIIRAIETKSTPDRKRFVAKERLAVCEDTNCHFSPARSTPPLKTFVGVFISAFLQIALMDSLYCALVIFL
jgi:hypothetical protein